MSKVIKIIVGDFEKCSRDKREISVIRELGHEVVVLNKGLTDDVIEVEPGYVIINRKVRDINAGKIKKIYQRVRSVISWIKISRQCQPDVISGHNLSGLIIGWASTLFTPKSKRPLLVYDAHEFEAGRNSVGNGRLLRKWIVPIIEKYLINRSEFTIMVNDSIAKNIKESYGLKAKPIVVRNVAKNWKLDYEVINQKRKEFYKELGVGTENFIIMYHGSIMRGRGIETLLQVISEGNDLSGVILGNGEQAYIQELKDIAKKLHIEKKVLFHPAVPVNDLWKYVGAADAGVTLASNICLNHYYMLPNKLFECIQSGTPIIGSDFPEISNIINTHKVGLCVDPDNVNSILKAVYEMKENKFAYNQMKENILKVKPLLSWEMEKKVLREAYDKVL